MGRIRESQYAYLDNHLPLSVHSRGQERQWAKNIPPQLLSLRSPSTHNKLKVVLLTRSNNYKRHRPCHWRTFIRFKWRFKVNVSREFHWNRFVLYLVNISMKTIFQLWNLFIDKALLFNMCWWDPPLSVCISGCYQTISGDSLIKTVNTSTNNNIISYLILSPITPTQNRRLVTDQKSGSVRVSTFTQSLK